MTNINRTNLACVSCIRFPVMVFGQLKLKKDKLKKPYKVVDGNYITFRETVNPKIKVTDPTVIVIRFRLKIAKNRKVLHWLFQRVCICTTPFWSGLPGFHIKMWMVDPATNNYMGIYEWEGRENAKDYISFLIPILQFFSLKNSIWYKIFNNIRIDKYLKTL